MDTFPKSNLARRVTYFLARETHSPILLPDGSPLLLESLSHQLGEDFNLEAALLGADQSIWRQATLERPYPNLEA